MTPTQPAWGRVANLALLMGLPAVSAHASIISALSPPRWQSLRLECGATYEVATTLSGYAALQEFRLGFALPAQPPKTKDATLAVTLWDDVPDRGALLRVPIEGCRGSARTAEVWYWASAHASRPVLGFLLSLSELPDPAAGAHERAPTPQPFSAPGSTLEPTVSNAGSWLCEQSSEGGEARPYDLTLWGDGTVTAVMTSASALGAGLVRCVGSWTSEAEGIDVSLRCVLERSNGAVRRAFLRRSYRAVSPTELVSRDSSCRRAPVDGL